MHINIYIYIYYILYIIYIYIYYIIYIIYYIYYIYILYILYYIIFYYIILYWYNWVQPCERVPLAQEWIEGRPSLQGPRNGLTVWEVVWFSEIFHDFSIIDWLLLYSINQHHQAVSIQIKDMLLHWVTNQIPALEVGRGPNLCISTHRNVSSDGEQDETATMRTEEHIYWDHLSSTGSVPWANLLWSAAEACSAGSALLPHPTDLWSQKAQKRSTAE